MHKIKELKDMLCDELEEYGGKDSLTAADLDIVDKLAHTVKNLDKVLEGSDGMSYSRRAYDGRSYDDGESSGDYSRRGRGPGAKRDSMGRYSSRGYSGAVEDIKRMMEEEQDPNKRHRYQGILQELEA